MNRRRIRDFATAVAELAAAPEEWGSVSRGSTFSCLSGMGLGTCLGARYTVPAPTAAFPSVEAN